MTWNNFAPPAPGVYRVNERYAPIWYRRWTGKHWCIGGETVLDAAHETERTDQRLDWREDDASKEYNAMAAGEALARHGAGRYTIIRHTGLRDRAARAVVSRLGPPRGPRVRTDLGRLARKIAQS